MLSSNDPLQCKRYTCTACGETFVSLWRDAKAREEAIRLVGVIPPEEQAVVCDDCFHRLHVQERLIEIPGSADHGL